MKPIWPDSFQRVPEDAWTRTPLAELALKYDTVEGHGWYRNLEPTVETLAAFLQEGAILIDYSGGTGILTDRLLQRIGSRRVGILIVDSSPKFLRLAYEKFKDEPRVAFRQIHYLRPQKRLEYLDEALEPVLVRRGADAIVSTNAIHLYTDLVETLRAWRRVIRGTGKVFVQSGNIRNPAARPTEWIIDETVEAIHEAARAIVEGEEEWARWRHFLEDEERMERYAALRRRYFLPVRPLSHYVGAFEEAGFEVEEIENRTIPASVEEWYEFLAVYHDGVLGWFGGAEKLEGRPPAPELVDARLRLLRRAMDRVFGGRERFDCCWTYLTCRPAPDGSGAGG